MSNPELEDPLLITEVTSELACGFSRNEIMDEAKKLLLLGVPLTLYTLMQSLAVLVLLTYLGHVGPLALSSASMANAAVSITGFDVLIGLTGALETFCGQSFGVNDYKMADVHMQRGILTLLLACIPIVILWAYLGEILIFLGQDLALATAAATYASFLAPSAFGTAVLLCFVVFLRRQGKVMELMIASSITVVGNIVWCWLLVFKTDLSGNGGAVGMDISVWFQAFLLIVWMKISPTCRKTKLSLSWEAFCGIPAFMRLAIPSAAMFCLESWFFQIILVFSGMLPNSVLETSSITICSGINTVALIFPTGLSAATTTRVSIELGAGNLKASRLSIFVALSMTAAERLPVILFTIVFRHRLVSLFSSDPASNKYAAEMLLIAAISQIFTAIQYVIFGSYKGSGCRKVGAFINLFAFYVIGIPCAAIFAFRLHLGGKGLYIGYIMAKITQVIGLGYAAWRDDGERARSKADISHIQHQEDQ